MVDLNSGLTGETIGNSGDNILSLTNLYKSYSASEVRLDVLSGINFEVKAGDTIAITGESGIGKSTLLHILGTLDKPDSGAYLFRKKNVFSMNEADIARFRNDSLGFVFQFHHLLPEFTALENVMMPSLIRGVKKSAAVEAAMEYLVRVGLEKRLNHRVNELSGGEQQRVAIARAVVLKPEILLADEPTGNLDQRNSDQIHELLLELNNEYKMTMVVVTHNLELAAYMSRNVTLVDGQLYETD